MNDILKTYMERFRENRHTLRRYTAFVLALAMITTLFVNWQLHGVGISMTAQYQCGEEEHTHTADCYTKVLTCGYEEGELENADEVAAAAATSQPTVEAEPAPLALEPQIEFVPHEHTEDCYTEVQTLTCMEEEHVHGDDCFDPEDGSLICDKFEHTHDESCYTTEYELTCGLEEGELVEQVVEPTQSAELAAMAVAEPVALEPTVDTVEPIYHHHTDACYEEVLTCPLPEHHHTVACLSDTSADVETPEEWQAANAEAVMTGNWDEDLLSVAKTQLGYEQSEKNFEIDPADGVTLHYYSRYGQSYGNPYGEWDVMFLSYCLKYAGIPQSAIPQEASVLALRSSMSDMDWLLDGEDGSAANVGDIVIYNKYVTRTVAVDSSADGAADDLDDQFSMDTDFENGAALETSGASALDAAPAAEDAPTADSVITPDLPDTANPEQPAAKPVDSTGTSASGADTLIPSVDSPAAEPQTTTVTDAQPVETVGIVSSVDSDADTLTVISGDVDGKVAEVTLSNAEVLAVVDVAAAQYADTYGGQLPTISASRPNRAPTLASGTTAELNENWIYKAFATVNGTDHTIKDNYIPQQVPNLTVKDGGSVELTYHFTIPTDSKLSAGTNQLTYKLPDGFTLSQDTSGLLRNESDDPIGSINVDTNGNVTLTFDGDDPLSGKQTTGHFYVDCTVDRKTTASKDEIKFPGGGTTIKIEQKTDLTVQKTGVHKGRTEDGKYKMHYTVTASSVNGSGKPIVLSDYLNLGSSFKDASYEGVTVTKVTQTGNTPLTKDTDFKVENVTSSGLGSDGVADGNPGIKITADGVAGLPALDENESYILEYDVVVDHIGPNGDTLSNRAYANDEKGPCDIYFQNEMGKSGSYDPDTGEITWKINIKPNGASIYGFELKDTLPAGHTMTGYFKVSGNSSGTILEETDKFTSATGFTYKFNNAKFDTNNPDYEYTVTYKTKAPAGFTVGSSVINSASLELNGNKKWDASGTASYDNRGQSHYKQALDNTTLDDSKANGEPFKMRWKLTVTPPYVWNESEGQSDKLLEITDCINKPWVSSGTVTSSDHYAILKDLHEEITKNLALTLKDGTEIKYSDLKNNKLSLQIMYYSTNDCSGTPLATVKLGDSSPTDTSHVGSFKLVFQKDGYTGARIDSVVISEYSTQGSFSGLNAGQTIGFKNESNGSSAEYKYNIPDKPAAMKLIKMSADKPPETAASAGFYAANNVKITAGNGTDGETYIYYQLKLETNKGIPALPATITDTLPGHVTYVDGSAQLIAADNEWYTASVDYSPATGSWLTNISLSDERFFTHTYDPTANSLKFTLNDEIKYVAGKFTSFYIRYAVKVNKDIWDSSLTTTQTQYFTNTAKWVGVGGSTTKTTVEYQNSLLEKIGSYDSTANEVTYSIVINPKKLKLGDESMITLTDKVVVPDRPKNSAALVDSSIKLYDYDAATGQKGVELPSDSYKTSYQETSEGYILTVQVLNEQSYLLEYKYANTSNTAYTMTNTAELYGYTTKTISTTVEHSNASGSAHTVGLTIHKVDSNNVKTSLTGAHFKLEKYNSTLQQFEIVNADIPAKATDGSYFYLSFSNSSSTAPDGTVLYPFNTLYRLTETIAPSGYAVDSTPRYFIWSTVGTDSNTAYLNAVGSTELAEVPRNDVSYYYEGDAITLTVKNTSNRLTIQKLWKDQNGTFMDSSDAKLPAEITVELYKCDAPKGVGTFVQEFKLTSATDWKTYYEIPADDLSRYFYVVETSTNTRYDVEYTVNYVKGADIILLTNKEKDNADYELPSTGGSGTLPYTAVGGTMMLSALAYSFIHRKRRREGRADD
jgi:LPXTG-motif cell wall-anchored protein